MKKKYKYVYEWCDNCETEVKLKAIKFVYQICPNCKELIKACSLCNTDNCNCTKCEEVKDNEKVYCCK